MWSRAPVVLEHSIMVGGPALEDRQGEGLSPTHFRCQNAQGQLFPELLQPHSDPAKFLRTQTFDQACYQRECKIKGVRKTADKRGFLRACFVKMGLISFVIVLRMMSGNLIFIKRQFFFFKLLLSHSQLD